PPPGGFSRQRPPGFVAPQSKIQGGYSPSLRLAIRPLARKQDPAEFSDTLLCDYSCLCSVFLSRCVSSTLDVAPNQTQTGRSSADQTATASPPKEKRRRSSGLGPISSGESRCQRGTRRVNRSRIGPAGNSSFVTDNEWRISEEIFAKAENAVFAVRPGGRGDITESHLAWKQTRGLPYVPSPLFYEGRVYVIKNGGMASCYEARTGRVLYQEERLGALGDYYASPVAADGKIYYASQQGVVTVVKAGDTFHVLARNDLEEQIMATPAIVDGNIYLRTANYLSAFGY
ncbi:MAG: hypothetical protein FJ398_18480, partial [Verrucomicrobia bacterium]|nr:hypothetical protein [Verrucomicrobiota bacterium]